MRCDDKELINHIIKGYKEDLIKAYKSDPKLLAGLQKILQQNGVAFTNIDDFVNQSKFHISISHGKVDEVNREIFCEMAIAIKVPFLVPKLNDDSIIVARRGKLQFNNDTIVNFWFGGTVLTDENP